MSEYTNRTHPIFQGTTNTNSVNLGITTKCTMKCPKCSVGVPRIAKEGKSRNATVEEIYRDSRWMQPMRRVHITGGEPTIHPQFNYIVNAVWDFFDATYVTLETNGAMFDRHRKVIKEVFDLVFITHYEKDAIYPGSPDNTSVIEDAEQWLGEKLIREPPVRHDVEHVPLGLRMQNRMENPFSNKPCSKWHDPGLPCGWYEGKVYPCCVSFGIHPNLGIPVTPTWREDLQNLDMGCAECCYRGT